MNNEEIAVKLTDHENEISSLKHRMNKAEDKIEQIHELTTSVKLIAQKQDNVVSKLDSLTNTVAEINKQPAEKWNKVTSTILTAVVSAIVTAVIAFIISNI